MVPEPRLEPLPPKEAIQALEARGRRLHETFSYKDAWGDEHGGIFTVAKSTGFDILGDVHSSLRDALAEGGTFDQWKKDITPVLQEKGWWGKQEILDPVTGQLVEAQLGSPRRLRTIYDTNMRVSRAAGHWAVIDRTKARRPWLRYVAVQDDRTRADHKHWHGTVLSVDDPWWDSHAPPNGWHCRCTVQQLNDRDLKRYGHELSPKPPDDPRPARRFRDPRTGREVTVPYGVDPGWGHNSGRAANRATTALTKLAAAPPDLAAAAPLVNRYLTEQVGAEYRAWIKTLKAQLDAKMPRPRHQLRPVGVVDSVVLNWLTAQGRAPASGVVAIFDDDVFHWLRDAKKAAVNKLGQPKALDLADLLRLPEILRTPDAVYWDTNKDGLIYTFQPADPRKGKVVVLVDCERKDDKRDVVTLNVARTGGYELPSAFTSGQYDKIK